MRENVTVYPGNSYPYYQDKKEKDFSLRSNPLKKHKRPHFLMWSFILQLKHPLVDLIKITVIREKRVVAIAK